MTAAALGQRLSRAKARLQAEGAALAILDADLASEALHLAEVPASLAPDTAEPRALLSLILHVQARKGARRAEAA